MELFFVILRFSYIIKEYYFKLFCSNLPDSEVFLHLENNFSVFRISLIYFEYYDIPLA